jgi:hypothetical protein
MKKNVRYGITRLISSLSSRVQAFFSSLLPFFFLGGGNFNERHIPLFFLQHFFSSLMNESNVGSSRVDQLPSELWLSVLILNNFQPIEEIFLLPGI